MDHFDEMAGLFRNLGLTEEQARIAATGREYRSEAEARAALAEDTAEDLADDLFVRTSETTSRPVQRQLAELTAALPLVQENAMLLLAGQPAKPMPWELPSGSATPAAEAAVDAAQEALRMTSSEAAAFVTRLQAREERRGGRPHAEKFLTDFASGLRRNLREAREVAF